MPFSYLLVHSWKCMALPGSWLVETIQKTWSACRGFCGWRQQWQAHSKKLHLTEATEIRHLFNSESAWAPSQICCLHMRINTSASIHIRLIQIIWSWHLDWMQRFRRSGRLNVSNGTVACALPTCRFCVHVLVLSNFKMWILVCICLDGTRLHNVTHDRWAPASILFTLQFQSVRRKYLWHLWHEMRVFTAIHSCANSWPIQIPNCGLNNQETSLLNAPRILHGDLVYCKDLVFRWLQFAFYIFRSEFSK